MKKKPKIKLAVTTLAIFSPMITAHQPPPQIPPHQPDVRPVSALIQSSRDNIPPPLVEHQISQTVPSQNAQSSTQNQPADNPMEEQNVTPSVNNPPQPTEKEKPTNTSVPPTEMPTKPTTTPPAPTSTEPKMGDTRIVNGKKQSYFLGFGWVDDMGENEVVYCEGMYENGNKIGIMGSGNVVDSDGDINKIVGIMD